MRQGVPARREDHAPDAEARRRAPAPLRAPRPDRAPPRHHLGERARREREDDARGELARGARAPVPLVPGGRGRRRPGELLLLPARSDGPTGAPPPRDAPAAHPGVRARSHGLRSELLRGAGRAGQAGHGDRPRQLPGPARGRAAPGASPAGALGAPGGRAGAGAEPVGAPAPLRTAHHRGCGRLPRDGRARPERGRDSGAGTGAGRQTGCGRGGERGARADGRLGRGDRAPPRCAGARAARPAHREDLRTAGPLRLLRLGDLRQGAGGRKAASARDRAPSRCEPAGGGVARGRAAGGGDPGGSGEAQLLHAAPRRARAALPLSPALPRIPALPRATRHRRGGLAEAGGPRRRDPRPRGEPRGSSGDPVAGGSVRAARGARTHERAGARAPGPARLGRELDRGASRHDGRGRPVARVLARRLPVRRSRPGARLPRAGVPRFAREEISPGRCSPGPPT